MYYYFCFLHFKQKCFNPNLSGLNYKAFVKITENNTLYLRLNCVYLRLFNVYSYFITEVNSSQNFIGSKCIDIDLANMNIRFPFTLLIYLTFLCTQGEILYSLLIILQRLPILHLFADGSLHWKIITSTNDCLNQVSSII